MKIEIAVNKVILLIRLKGGRISRPTAKAVPLRGRGARNTAETKVGGGCFVFDVAVGQSYYRRQIRKNPRTLCLFFKHPITLNYFGDSNYPLGYSILISI